jgi:hypothetical protein
MRGRTRCHLHGGLSFGPPPGSQNGMVHGRRSRAAEQARKERTAKAREARAKVAEAVALAEAAVKAAAKRQRRRKVKPPESDGPS